MKTQGDRASRKWMAVLFGCMCISQACDSSSKAKPPIKMGIMMPLTSTAYGDVAKAQVAGINLAVKHFQADTGLTVVVPDPVDDQTDATTVTNHAAEAAQELIDQDQVVAFMGGYSTEPITAAAEVAEARGVPFMTAGAVAPDLASRQFTHFFRLTTTNGYVAGQLGLLKELLTDITRVAVLYTETSDNAGWGATILPQLTAAGLQVVYSEKFSATVATVDDYAQVVQRAKAATPAAQAILAASASYSKMVLAAVQVWPTTATEANPLKAFIGTWALASQTFLTAAGQYAENTFGLSPWEPGSAPQRAKDLAQRIMQDFQTDYGTSPMYLNMLGYCQAILVLDACKRVIDAGDDLTPANVTVEMRKTDRILPIGEVVFDAVGDSKYYVPRVVQIQDGKVVVIYPIDVKAADPRPGVSW